MVSDEVQKKFDRIYGNDLPSKSGKQKLKITESQNLSENDLDEELDEMINRMDEQWKNEYKDSVFVVLTSFKFWIAQLLLVLVSAVCASFVTYHWMVK